MIQGGFSDKNFDTNQSSSTWQCHTCDSFRCAEIGGLHLSRSDHQIRGQSWILTNISETKQEKRMKKVGLTQKSVDLT